MKWRLLIITLLASFTAQAYETIPNHYRQSNGEKVLNRLSKEFTSCHYCSPDDHYMVTGINFSAEDLMSPLGFRKKNRLRFHARGYNSYTIEQVFNTLLADAHNRFNHFEGKLNFHSNKELKQGKKPNGKTSCWFEDRMVLELTLYVGERSWDFSAREVVKSDSWEPDFGSCLLPLADNWR